MTCDLVTLAENNTWYLLPGIWYLMVPGTWYRIPLRTRASVFVLVISPVPPFLRVFGIVFSDSSCRCRCCTTIAVATTIASANANAGSNINKKTNTLVCTNKDSLIDTVYSYREHRNADTAAVLKLNVQHTLSHILRSTV